jgi:hypothetical protein
VLGLWLAPEVWAGRRAGSGSGTAIAKAGVERRAAVMVKRLT